MDITESLTKILLFGHKETLQALYLQACRVLAIYSHSIVAQGLGLRS